MIVVEIRPDLSFEVVDREKEMVRLGAGGLDGRALTPEAMHAALQVLAKFRRLAESHRVDDIVAVATSATREAGNGGDFLRTVADQTGIRPQGISRTQERRPIPSAAGYGLGLPRGAAGGGDNRGRSVEGLGMEKGVRGGGVGGGGGDLVVAGAILVDEILRRLGADDITLCDLSLREGLVLDYVARHRQQIAHADRYPDVRRRSVIELAERCNYWPAHAHQVARLATSLVDQTRVIHGWTDRQR